MKAPERYERSLALIERARGVIPGGAWGHNKFPAAFNPADSPWFAERGEGAYLYDVDGNRFIDFLCGYGAMINGYANPIIDRAFTEQSARGECLSLPTARTVEFADYLCGLIQGATWCSFGKNGSDATGMAFLIARAYTSRRNIVCFSGSYHGAQTLFSCFNPGAGRQPEDSQAVLPVRWNDVEGLEQTFGRHGETIAAVMSCPWLAPFSAKAEMATPAFLEAIARLRTKWGALWISDDVRGGFRFDLRGSHVAHGVQPDLMCYAKAIANGYPLAVVAGAEFLRGAAESIFMGGTFWSVSSAMAGALANLRLLAANDSVAHMKRLGTRLTEGLRTLGRQHSIEIEISGPPSMPTVMIANDPELKTMNDFCRHMAAAGTLLDPRHNWFLSAAHKEQDIDESLNHADTAFAKLAKR